MRLILVRHGQTEWNVERRLQGWKDSPLSENGKEQVKKVAELLKSEKIDLAYCSDLGRAVTTAEEILKFHDCSLEKTKLLREINYGKMEGLTQSESEKLMPGVWNARLSDRYNLACPGGENYKTMVGKRIKPFLEMVFEKHKDENVLVVSHRGPTRGIIGEISEIKGEELSNIAVDNDTVYFLEIKDGKLLSITHCKAGQKKIENGLEKTEKLDFSP